MDRHSQGFREGIETAKSKLYREGIWWIALNDSPGSDDALNAKSIAGYISVVMLADLMKVPAKRIALDIVNYRKANP